MGTASGKSPDSQEADDGQEGDEILANLTFLVDKYGDVMYNMNWEDGETGIFSLTKIFYELMHNGFIELILSKIKEQCVLNNTELEYESFLKLIQYHANESMEEESSSSPLIPPDKSAYTI
jgi:hypothetical protein